MLRKPTLRLVLTVACLAACGDDDSSATDTGVDAFDSGTDAVVDAAVDQGVDVEVPYTCETAIAETTPVLLAPSFRRAEIHPAAAFDGEHIWIALSATDDPGPPTACTGDDTTPCEEGQSCSDDVCVHNGFDVALVRMRCDGVLEDPIMISEATPPSDIDPAIAIAEDRVILAWQRDEGTGTIRTALRAYDLEGNPLGETTTYASVRGGEPVEGTVWFPSLMPKSDGFWLWGIRGIDEVGGFLGYLQELDESGAPVGEGQDVFFEGASTGQNGFELAPRGDDLHWAWTEHEQAVYLAPDATEPRLLLEGFVGSSVGGLTVQNDRVLAVVQAGAASATINLVDAESGTRSEVGRGRVASPFLATGDGDEGVVLWLGDARGFVAEELWVRSYQYDGAEFTLGDARTVATLGSLGIPYRPSVHHLRDGFYLVTWAEREGDTWRSYAQILDL
ncbi:MAG: hypothetical protein AAGE52_32805 [Myxococcota bacterium]